ncbi:hypothetical protein RHMOL_Rhmol09G0090000 [Rhododendron molle]|uniref:Uncharacterized protein n=1 Tax=Rhododendron molle TaxID=49168 RepID=A0ACC0MB63_RHOML|nr:hypothetical protein RHMOL_Rhmol09G0090000 [Rhododendron molle]
MELEQYFSLYEGTCDKKEFVVELSHRLNYLGSPAPKDRWMIMPEIGHLIASVFHVVLVFLSNHQCLTFIPLRFPPLPPESRSLIALGHVNGSLCNCIFATEFPHPTYFKELVDKSLPICGWMRYTVFKQDRRV